MRGRFRLTPGGRHPHEPWFHIGTLEVTTSWLVVLLSVAALIVSAVVGSGSLDYGFRGTLEYNLTAAKMTVVDDLRIWTLLTWPFAYWGVSLWDAIAIFLFWYFASDVERSVLGKKRFLWMLAIWTVLLGAVFVGLNALAGVDAELSGLSMLEIMVLLLWIAEWPTRMFFFNIPAWVVGIVIVGIQVLSYLGTRNWTLLVTFLVGIVVCGFVARQFGMLADYPWIPRLGTPRRRTPKTPKGRKRDFDPGRPTVVSGPWSPPPATPPPAPSRDEQRMDELLDKIHESGTASLTDAEQAELRELSERRRRRS